MRHRSARGSGCGLPGTARDACEPISLLTAGSCNVPRPATGQTQQHRKERDDHEEVEHGKSRAVSDIRAISIHAVNETRHRIGGAAGPACRHVDDDVGELQFENDPDDENGDAHRQHDRERHMPERLPPTRTVDLGGFQYLLGHRLQPGQQHDHDKGYRDPGVHRLDAEARNPGGGEERRIFPSEIARQRGRRAKAVFHDRLADHPAHGNRTEHQGQQKYDAKEFSRPYLGVQQQRQSKRNRIFANHGNRIEDHVAERVPVVVVVEQSDEIAKAVKVRAFKRAEIPIQRSDVDPEQRRKNHHRNGEQDGGEQKQRPPTAFSPNQDLSDTERDRPEQIGIENRAPVGEPSRDGSGRVQNLDEEHEQAPQRGEGHKRASSALPADRSALQSVTMVPVIRRR